VKPCCHSIRYAAGSRPGFRDKAGIAILAGSVVLSGQTVTVTGRRYLALTLPAQRIVGVVHVGIDRREPLVWNPVQRESSR
jgi:hypothetical protein